MGVINLRLNIIRFITLGLLFFHFSCQKNQNQDSNKILINEAGELQEKSLETNLFGDYEILTEEYKAIEKIKKANPKEISIIRVSDKGNIKFLRVRGGRLSKFQSSFKSLKKLDTLELIDSNLETVQQIESLASNLALLYISQENFRNKLSFSNSWIKLKTLALNGKFFHKIEFDSLVNLKFLYISGDDIFDPQTPYIKLDKSIYNLGNLKQLNITGKVESQIDLNRFPEIDITSSSIPKVR